MFHYIEGVISILEPNLAVVDCSGVGFELNISLNTQSRLRIGEKARLYCCSIIREDCFDLYGFYSKEEKHTFEMLIGVSGVGPKAAQAILSANTPDALYLAIVSGNERALTCAPGIGKKIAQRVLLELKDKIGKEAGGAESFVPGPSMSAGPAQGDKLADATAALTVLGYGSNDIAAALKGVDVQTMSVEDIIRSALRNMMKK